MTLAVAAVVPQVLRVLVVDDDEDVRSMLTGVLEDEGYHVRTAGDSAQALAALTSEPVDVVLLDVVLPATNGIDVMTEMRRRADVPIIFVTGRGSETDKVLGLRMGADDYVVKPFSAAELVARIHSVLRRFNRSTPAPQNQPLALDFDDLRVDVVTRDVTCCGEMIDMTAKEFDLLHFLASSPRQVFSREQILEQVWSSSTEWQDPATVTEHVRRIRKKIEKNPDEPRWLKTVRGVGYRFQP
jgi:two-component system phosphate regulon response regulator PhoB